MINDLFIPNKLSTLLKNKFGSFVLQKAINFMSSKDKEEVRNTIVNKIDISSTKEKNRINSFLNLLY
jgi:hypothetical protein